MALTLDPVGSGICAQAGRTGFVHVRQSFVDTRVLYVCQVLAGVLCLVHVQCHICLFVAVYVCYVFVSVLLMMIHVMHEWPLYGTK